MGIVDDRLLTINEVKRAPARIRDEFRYRIQTDVFYLANNVLRSPRQAPLIHSVHDSIIAAYPTPNPEVPFGEWSPLKTRILLAARRSLKTTLGECWLTSAILCDPNSRTLILSGNMPAAEARCRGVRQHLSNEVILELFPEYNGKLSSEMATYWCPAATEKHRDPTIQTGTFESVKTGQHPSLCIWLDDCTNELTCSSAVTVAKTLSRYYDLDPLLEDENGFTIFTGTRWGDVESDLPEIIRQHCEVQEQETGERCHRYVCVPAWTVKTTGTAEEIIARNDREANHRLKESDVDLWWPQKLSWKFLSPKYRKDPLKFAKQYLMNPEQEEEKIAIFPPGLMERATRTREQLPSPHLVDSYANFDLTSVGSTSRLNDNSCGVVAWRERATGRLTFVDAMLGTFLTSTDLATAMVQLLSRWWSEIKGVRIESASGAPLLRGELLAIAAQWGLEGFDSRVEFLVPDNKANAKRARVFSCAPPLLDGQISFYDEMPYLSEIKKQFSKFTTTSSPKWDDAADSVAQCYQWLATKPLAAAPERPIEERYPPFDDDLVALSRPAPVTPTNDDSVEKSAAEYQTTVFKMPESDL